MEILMSSQVCNADEAREHCYKRLQSMTIAELKLNEHFTEMDEQSLRNVLLPKAERLEECLSKIQPQLVGLVDFVLYLWPSSNDAQLQPRRCPLHYTHQKAAAKIKTRINCDACIEMFTAMANNSRYSNGTPRYSSLEMHFDEDITNVLQEMFDLLKT
jgi:hypothetical protein